MLALLVCGDRSCRAAFEAEGSRDAMAGLRCQDCGGLLHAAGWADAEEQKPKDERVQMRRAA